MEDCGGNGSYHGWALFAAVHVLPGPSGSPHTGGVNLLPSGYFRLRSKGCFLQKQHGSGKRLGNQVIEQYIADEGKYPENIGMVFWIRLNMLAAMVSV